jgi:hypothetical protein
VIQPFRGTQMKADTFARLVVLETLIEAQTGDALDRGGLIADAFREELVTAISDLLDEIDSLDALVAARVYDALVDFLAELPEDPEGLTRSILRLQREIAVVVERGLPAAERGSPATWAVVLDELLAALGDAYHARQSEPDSPLARLRVMALMGRLRVAAERILGSPAGAGDAELRDELGRLVIDVQHLLPPASELDLLIRSLQRRTRRYRRTSLTRVGRYVVAQLLSRRRGAGAREEKRETDAGQRGADAT